MTPTSSHPPCSGAERPSAVLRRRNLPAAEIVARYRELAETLDAAPLEVAALRDPDDAAVLACAVAAAADLIVSGDRDLLELRSYRGIPILKPADALARVLAGR